MYVTEGVKRLGNEGEWLGIKYGTGDRIIFGVPVLEMALEKTQGEEVGARGIGGSKYEGCCVGEKILVNYFCVCFGVIGEGSTLIELRGLYGGT